MAGGSGTRMNSQLPKQLLKVGNLPMMVHLLNHASALMYDVVLVVSNKNKDIIINTLLEGGYIKNNGMGYICGNINVTLCIQPVANGTGGAIMATKDFFANKSPDSLVVVLSADVPLITKKTIVNMFDHLTKNDVSGCILGRCTNQNFGYGRIVTDSKNMFVRIVEEKDCTDTEKMITLINTGTYGFKLGPLMGSLSKLNPNNSQNEYYLTDCPRIIKENYQIKESSSHYPSRLVYMYLFKSLFVYFVDIVIVERKAFFALVSLLISQSGLNVDNIQITNDNYDMFIHEKDRELVNRLQS